MISVIIPTYNERKNLPLLIGGFVSTLNAIQQRYELIFVDDHSNDETWEYLSNLQKHLSIVHVYLKKGPKGKAFSLIEGFNYARGDKIVMIDADLQYEPKVIPKMIKLLDKYDIVVGNRVPTKGKYSLRRIMSLIFKNVIGGIILGLPYDIQSGLKVFKKSVLHNLELSPSKWGFDGDFLFKAKRMKWRIGQMNIAFLPRYRGESKINIISDGWELVRGALKIRFKYVFLSIFKFLDYPHHSERLPVKLTNRKDFLFLPEIYSAKKHIYSETFSFALLSLVTTAGTMEFFKHFFGVPILIFISACGALFYIGLMLFKLIVTWESIRHPFLSFSKREIGSINNKDLPTYTIIVPLYQEAEVIRQIIKAMSKIDYPTEKIDLIITLEEYDLETIEAIEQALPPEHFKTLILPNVKPKTKPKALNVALLQARGEFLVIYDAEIIPEPDQLKKAYLAFRNNPDIACLQTRLDHYNAGQNTLTKLFNAEFSYYFDLFLPGLQKLGFPVPLSGHSTHFRTDMLKKIGGWDPYNVTEDCEVGIRLARQGYKVEILDSISFEEATSSIGAWIRQRSRWIKGFIQTSIVHLRHPFRFKREVGGWRNFFAFIFTIPLSVATNLLNFFYWCLLIAWFATKSVLISQFFPGIILYISLLTFIAGNFIFVYLNLIGAYKRGRYEFVKFGLLAPLYWLLLAFATFKASVEIVVRPHHWEKTKHGQHLVQKPDLIPLNPNYDVEVS